MWWLGESFLRGTAGAGFAEPPLRCACRETASWRAAPVQGGVGIICYGNGDEWPAAGEVENCFRNGAEIEVIHAAG